MSNREELLKKKITLLKNSLALREKIKMLKDSLGQPSSLPKKLQQIQQKDIEGLIEELETELKQLVLKRKVGNKIMDFEKRVKQAWEDLKPIKAQVNKIMDDLEQDLAISFEKYTLIPEFDSELNIKGYYISVKKGRYVDRICADKPLTREEAQELLNAKIKLYKYFEG